MHCRRRGNHFCCGRCRTGRRRRGLVHPATTFHLLFLVAVASIVYAPFAAMSSSSSSLPGFEEPLTIHLVPHSHCDAGYKKTPEEYYTTEIRSVLSSVTEYLWSSSSNGNEEKFVWSEVLYLERWFHDASVPRHAKGRFRQLVKQGRIELVNGGYVMHDEAITTYQSQIVQTKLGLDALRGLGLLGDGSASSSGGEWNVTTGYQIDPFGNSVFTPLLLHWNGYDTLIANRIPLELKEEFKKIKSLEFWWKPYDSTGTGSAGNAARADGTTSTAGSKVNDEDDVKVWVHVYDSHYETPPGFDWENHLAVDSTPLITDANVADRAMAFVDVAVQRSDYYRTPHVLMPFGQDYRFQNATLEFDNMNRIMEHIQNQQNDAASAIIKKHGRTVTMRYSTIREYRRAVFSYVHQQQQHNRRQQDRASDEEKEESFFPTIVGSNFLPLVDDPVDHNWSGYYFQYPSLKQRVRVAELLVRSAEALYAAAALGTARRMVDVGEGGEQGGDLSPSSHWYTRRTVPGQRRSNEEDWENQAVIPSLERAKRTVALMQHHDALPGTGYQHVMLDYAAKLDETIHDLADSTIPLLLSVSPEGNVSPFINDAPPWPEGLVLPRPSIGLVGGGSYLSNTIMIQGDPEGSGPSTYSIVRLEMATPVTIAVVNPGSTDVQSEPVHVVTTRDDIVVRRVGADGEIAVVVPSQINVLQGMHSMVPLYQLTFYATGIAALGGAGYYTLETCDVTTTTDDVPKRTEGCATVAQTLVGDELDRALYDAGIGSDGGGSGLRLKFDRDSGDLVSLVDNDDDPSEQQRWTTLRHTLWEYDGELDSVYCFNPRLEQPPRQLKADSHSGGSIEATVGPLYSEATVGFDGGHRITYRVYHYPQDDEGEGRPKSAMQVNMVTGVMNEKTNLLSKFETELVAPDDGGGEEEGQFWTEESGYVPASHSYRAGRSLGSSLQPLVSRAWIEGTYGDNSGANDKSKLTTQQRFTVRTVDPRGVVSTGDGVVLVAWHRRNRDPKFPLKSGNDASRVRSSVWVSFGRPSSADATTDKDEWLGVSDLVAVQVGGGSGGTVSSHTGNANGLFVASLPRGIIVPHVSVRNDILQLVLQGCLSEEHNDASSDAITVCLEDLLCVPLLDASLRSLTFQTANQYTACVLSVEDEKHRVTVTKGTLCAVEVRLA